MSVKNDNVGSKSDFADVDNIVGLVSPDSPNDNKIDLSRLAELRAKKTKEKEEKKEEKIVKKRGRPKKKKGLSDEDIFSASQVVEPILEFASYVMGKRGLVKLSDDELEKGVEAFSPLCAKYLPMLEDKGVWIAPVMWVGLIVDSRVNNGDGNGESKTQRQLVPGRE